MGRSFFLGTDAELYTGSDNFSTKIAAMFASLGLSSSQCTAYAALNTTWKAAYLTSITPETRTKAAVAAKNSAKKPLKIMASDLAKIIDGNPSVPDSVKLELGLNVRATPAPVAPPGTPTDFSVGLVPADGSLILKWTCRNPRNAVGVMYQIARKIDDATEWSIQGNIGKRKFIDSAIPAGSSMVTYRIQAQRTTSQGEPANFTVQLTGAGGGAGMTAKVVDAA